MNDVQCRSVFRSKLKNRIKAADMKTGTLAKLAGVSLTQANRWLEGSLMPTWEQFVRLTEIFGVEADGLLGTGISRSSYEKRFK